MSEEPPQVRASTARDEFLAAADELADVDDIAERAQREQEAAHDLVDDLARAVLDGLSPSMAKQMVGVAADASNHYTKTAFKDLLGERLEQAKQEDSDRRPFDEIVRQDLEEVLIVRTTDARQSTHYRWEFVGGSVETTANAESREHFHWAQFRDEYFDATGEDAAKPNQGLRDPAEWREFIVEMIDARGREVETRGPRTSTVDDLKGFISRSRAYKDLEAMVERDGLYVNNDPRDAEPTELWIQNHDIKRICEENELASVRELQIELDARGYTVDRVNGVSESTTVNGEKVTYWVLDPDIADYGEFVPDPVDPAEAVRMAEESDEDDGAEPGAIGSVGGGGDD
jgi:hypothetical protein